MVETPTALIVTSPNPEKNVIVAVKNATKQIMASSI